MIILQIQKKICLALLVLLPAIPAFSQTPFWGEDFVEPQEWTLEGNWYLEYGYMRFSWDPVTTNYDMSAISPLISLDDREYGLSIIQYLEPWVISATTEKAEISILAGGDEFLLWSHDVGDGVWGVITGTEVNFDISEYGGQDIRIKFRSYGPTTDSWFWWDVFSLSIITFLDNDMAITRIAGPVNLEIDENGTWEVKVRNNGMDFRKDYTLSLFDVKTGNLIGSVTEEDSLAFGGTMTYYFEWSSDSAYNTAFMAVLENDGDEYELNNVSPGKFIRVKPDREFNILVWDRDNGISSIVDPERGDIIQPTRGVTRALDDAGFEYDTAYNLPDNLQDYDVILSILGCYCVS